jgi:hypothetical protein
MIIVEVITFISVLLTIRKNSLNCSFPESTTVETEINDYDFVPKPKLVNSATHGRFYVLIILKKDWIIYKRDQTRCFYWSQFLKKIEAGIDNVAIIISSLSSGP